MNFDIINRYDDFIEEVSKKGTNTDVLICRYGEILEKYTLDYYMDATDIYNAIKEFYCYSDYEMEELTIELQ